ncbi:MAG TPA: hypothetical protein VI731_09160, partial [Bacteroidia bacterium]|nr:hypothetical protein [Bacteroidia bacterium]
RRICGYPAFRRFFSSAFLLKAEVKRMKKTKKVLVCERYGVEAFLLRDLPYLTFAVSVAALSIALCKLL